MDSLKKIGCFSVNTEMQETRALSNAYFPIFTNTSSSCFQGDDPVGRFLWAYFFIQTCKAIAEFANTLDSAVSSRSKVSAL